MIILEENFKWHLEAFASELFIYFSQEQMIRVEIVRDPSLVKKNRKKKISTVYYII